MPWEGMQAVAERKDIRYNLDAGKYPMLIGLLDVCTSADDARIDVASLDSPYNPSHVAAKHKLAACFFIGRKTELELLGGNRPYNTQYRKWRMTEAEDHLKMLLGLEGKKEEYMTILGDLIGCAEYTMRSGSQSSILDELESSLDASVIDALREAVDHAKISKVRTRSTERDRRRAVASARS